MDVQIKNLQRQQKQNPCKQIFHTGRDVIGFACQALIINILDLKPTETTDLLVKTKDKDIHSMKI